MVKSFSFDPREFPELARWLENIGRERGRLAREVTLVLNAHVTGKPQPAPRALPTEALRSIQEQLDRIEARLQGSLVSTTVEADPDPTEGLPEDVLANLDKLAL